MYISFNEPIELKHTVFFDPRKNSHEVFRIKYIGVLLRNDTLKNIIAYTDDFKISFILSQKELEDIIFNKKTSFNAPPHAEYLVRSFEDFKQYFG